MKLEAVGSRMNVNPSMEAFPSKEVSLTDIMLSFSAVYCKEPIAKKMLDFSIVTTHT